MLRFVCVSASDLTQPDYSNQSFRKVRRKLDMEQNLKGTRVVEMSLSWADVKGAPMESTNHNVSICAKH